MILFVVVVDEDEVKLSFGFWNCSFLSLICLGLCGGGVYVGCFYYVLKETKIPPQYKELCMNIATLFNDFGVLLSSIVCVIFDNTFMKTSLKWRNNLKNCLVINPYLYILILNLVFIKLYLIKN